MTASVYVKGSCNVGLFYSLSLKGIKIWSSKYLSGSEKNSRQVYKYLATTLAKSQKSTIL